MQTHRAALENRVGLRAIGARRLAPALLVLMLWPLPGRAQSGAAGNDPAPPGPGLIDPTRLDAEILVELKYASADNFMKRDVYGSLRRCYLQPEAARMLAAASRELRRIRPELRLLVHDCARPLRVQWIMWKLVAGTPSQRYVADPRRGGSMHNLAAAVDLSLADRNGRALDLGGRFDETGPAAEPRLELPRRKSGALSALQLSNRLLLRLVMVQAGFIPLVNEWWHFDCALPAEARKRYRVVP